jgi:hypothetical protein
MISSNLIINQNYSLQFDFNLKLFYYLFKFLLKNDDYMNINLLLSKIIFEIKNLKILNYKQINNLFINCLECLFPYIKTKIITLRDFNDLNRIDNKIIINFIQILFSFYHKILNKELFDNRSFDFIDFFKHMNIYLSIKNDNENFGFLNIPFYLILIKYGIRYFKNNPIKLKDENINCFLLIIISHIKNCINLCNKVKNIYGRTDFIKKIYLWNKNIDFIDYIYSNKNYINTIILYINNNLLDKQSTNLIKAKQQLIKIFKIDNKNITLSDNKFNHKIKIYINNIINMYKISPWEMPREKNKEIFILFYLLRFLSFLIDLIKGNKIEQFSKPKTNLRQFCNIFFYLKIFFIFVLLYLFILMSYY